jgi:imidazolonepropionase-like amidohydrolase
MKTLLPVISFFLLTTIPLYSKIFAIRNVSVVSMEREGMDRNQTILIEDGKIKNIGANLKIPSNATVIDGTGKFVIPGLFDMHAHFYYEQGKNVDTSNDELKLMLANGLTTVRIACGDSVYLYVRKMIRQGKWEGPELIVTSPQIVGSWPWTGKVFAGICKTPEQGKDAVLKYKREGYDQIKLTFMVSREVYDAIVETAEEAGIKVMGHVGPLVKLPRALEAGQQIEHMDEFIDMLLPDTSYNHGQSVSDMNLWRKKAWETVPQLDESKIPALVKSVKESGVYVTPTNHFFHSFFGVGIDKERIKQSTSFQYVPAVLKDYAWEVHEAYWKNPPPEADRKKYVYLRGKIIHELWKAGVPLMAGSDSPQWFSVPGFAIHDELENLVHMGLSPYAALQCATIHPATYMGFEKRTGSIAVGKEADLVMLDKNPLEDIRNTRSINGVFNKKWYSREDLDKLLDEAKKLSQ